MNISKKRTCADCKAFCNVTDVCNLRYDIEVSKIVYGISVMFKPVEKCPKPKTNANYMFALNHYINKEM